jgi:two-component system, NtrC family, response regulator AtoC
MLSANAGPVGLDWVVRDPAMLQLHEMAAAVARGNISVLIVGETGSGKEILAEAIHRQSPREGRTFLRLNCATFPQGLLESELFGHERGAFTGAVQSKPGLLESADGGTVFLDEIGELPPEVQAKLLRVLEDGAVMPVGGRRPRSIRVRFVCATNRDLESEMDRGLFRRDLYYRLGGAVLHIPPLRDRPDEIEPLANLFLARAARDGGSALPPRLTAAALARLREHPWPGNVRELRNVIERAVLLCRDGEITLDHLPAHWNSRRPPRAVVGAPLGQRELLQVTGGFRPPLGPTTPGPERPRLVDLPVDERDRIISALDSCAGNQTRAARLLGVSRATLLRRLSAYGFARPRSSTG